MMSTAMKDIFKYGQKNRQLKKNAAQYRRKEAQGHDISAATTD